MENHINYMAWKAQTQTLTDEVSCCMALAAFRMKKFIQELFATVWDVRWFLLLFLTGSHQLLMGQKGRFCYGSTNKIWLNEFHFEKNDKLANGKTQ